MFKIAGFSFKMADFVFKNFGLYTLQKCATEIAIGQLLVSLTIKQTHE